MLFFFFLFFPCHLVSLLINSSLGPLYFFSLWTFQSLLFSWYGSQDRSIDRTPKYVVVKIVDFPHILLSLIVFPPIDIIKCIVRCAGTRILPGPFWFSHFSEKIHKSHVSLLFSANAHAQPNNTHTHQLYALIMHSAYELSQSNFNRWLRYQQQKKLLL